MNKKLFLMRHSEASSFASSDYERELTQYGKKLVEKNSYKFKNYLNKHNIGLEYCFYSSSKRTSETFDIFNDIIDSKLNSVKTMALYLTGMRELKEIFKSYENKIEECNNIIIIAHNFGISNIASVLIGKDIYMDVADIVSMEITLSDLNVSWKDLLDFEGSWDIINQ